MGVGGGVRGEGGREREEGREGGKGREMYIKERWGEGGGRERERRGGDGERRDRKREEGGREGMKSESTYGQLEIHVDTTPSFYVYLIFLGFQCIYTAPSCLQRFHYLIVPLLLLNKRSLL